MSTSDNTESTPAEQVYRKLVYFYQNAKAVHFCLTKGGWENGYIRTLDRHNLTFVLDEFQNGEIVFLCEEIDPDTIEPYRWPAAKAEVRS